MENQNNTVVTPEDILSKLRGMSYISAEMLLKATLNSLQEYCKVEEISLPSQKSQ